LLCLTPPPSSRPVKLTQAGPVSMSSETPPGPMTQLLADMLSEIADASSAEEVLGKAGAGDGSPRRMPQQVEEAAELAEAAHSASPVTQLLEEVLADIQGPRPAAGSPLGDAGPSSPPRGGDMVELAAQMGGLALAAAPEAAVAGDAAVGLVYDELMELHCAPEDHYECAKRTVTLMAKLEEDGLAARCSRLPSRRATDAELLEVHTQEHIQGVDTVHKEGAGEEGTDPLGDMFSSAGTAAAARLAAGCVTEAALQVVRGTVQRAMAVVRPPGHHAECSRAMGFCFFNNVVVAARAALHEPGVHRVLILDWDVHHGNGIQHILEDDPAVMYVSLHRGNGFYPNTGDIHEVGTGKGAGFTLNVPWPKGGFGNADYMAAFELVIEPVVESFAPDLIIVSAGYDAVVGDPLGNMKVTAEGYGHMTRSLMRYAGGRVVAALEGGYNVRATAECAAETVRVMLEGTTHELTGTGSRRPRLETRNVLEKVAACHESFWPVLRRERFALRLQAAFKHAAAAAAVQPQKRDAGRGRRPGKKVAAGQPDWDVEIFI